MDNLNPSLEKFVDSHDLRELEPTFFLGRNASTHRHELLRDGISDQDSVFILESEDTDAANELQRNNSSMAEDVNTMLMNELDKLHQEVQETSEENKSLKSELEAFKRKYFAREDTIRDLLLKQKKIREAQQLQLATMDKASLLHLEIQNLQAKALSQEEVIQKLQKENKELRDRTISLEENIEDFQLTELLQPTTTPVGEESHAPISSEGHDKLMEILSTLLEQQNLMWEDVLSHRDEQESDKKQHETGVSEGLSKLNEELSALRKEMFKLKSREAGRVGEDVEIMELLTKILEEQMFFKDNISSSKDQSANSDELSSVVKSMGKLLDMQQSLSENIDGMKRFESSSKESEMLEMLGRISKDQALSKDVLSKSQNRESLNNLVDSMEKLLEFQSSLQGEIDGVKTSSLDKQVEMTKMLTKISEDQASSRDALSRVQSHSSPQNELNNVLNSMGKMLEMQDSLKIEMSSLQSLESRNVVDEVKIIELLNKILEEQSLARDTASAYQDRRISTDSDGLNEVLMSLGKLMEMHHSMQQNIGGLKNSEDMDVSDMASANLDPLAIAHMWSPSSAVEFVPDASDKMYENDNLRRASDGADQRRAIIRASAHHEEVMEVLQSLLDQQNELSEGISVSNQAEAHAYRYTNGLHESLDKLFQEMDPMKNELMNLKHEKSNQSKDQAEMMEILTEFLEEQAVVKDAITAYHKGSSELEYGEIMASLRKLLQEQNLIRKEIYALQSTTPVTSEHGGDSDKSHDQSQIMEALTKLLEEHSLLKDAMKDPKSELKVKECTHTKIAFTVNKRGWWCSLCHKLIPLHSKVYGCRRCDYDECESCHRKTVQRSTSLSRTPDRSSRWKVSLIE